MKNWKFLGTEMMFVSALILTLASCKAATPTPETAEEGLAALNTIPVSRVTASSTPLSATPDPTPTKEMTPTPAPSVTVTPSPLPTLLPDEALATVFMLFETNRGCLLPCWWGFTPGQTDWLTAKQFLSPIAKVIYEPPESRRTLLWSVEVHLPNTDYTNVPIIHNYLIEEDIIQAFEVWMQEPTSFFTPISVLNTYGIPEEIYLRSGQGDTGYLMTFFYPKFGFRIGYAIEEGTNENGNISACFQGDEFTGLTMWSPERELSFIETYTLFRREDAGDYQIPLDIATSMDVPTFYEMFRDPDVPICLETPTDIWPGY